MRMLRQHGLPAEDPFVYGFRFDLDAPDELEHSTPSVFLRQILPLRQDDELERLAFDPARVESVRCRSVFS
jgi:hypothetical protein